VELAPIGTPEVLAHAIGLAVGVPEQPGRPMEDVLVDGLAEAEPVLLVLDNCYRVESDGLHVSRALIALARTAYADGDTESGHGGMRAALVANQRFATLR
jgi:predicted ATPase